MSDATAPSSAVGFVVANVWMALGVFFLGWDAPFLAVLYWYETVVLGTFALLKILIAGDVPKSTGEKIGWALGRVVETAGYTVALSLMCTITGIFVFAMWTTLGRDAVAESELAGLSLLLAPLRDDWGARVSLVLFVAMNAYSYAVDYVGGGTYRHLDAREDLKYVPIRVGALFIMIFGGMLVIGFTGAPRHLAVVLVAAKLYADLAVRRRWEIG